MDSDNHAVFAIRTPSNKKENFHALRSLRITGLPAPYVWVVPSMCRVGILPLGSIRERYVELAPVLVGVLWYLVASHLRLLGLVLGGGHGLLVLPLRKIVEPRMP
jgi:hypothetical protein